MPVGQCDTSSRSRASSSETLIFERSAITESGICCCSRCERSRLPKLPSIAHLDYQNTASPNVDGGDVNGCHGPMREETPRNLEQARPPRAVRTMNHVRVARCQSTCNRESLIVRTILPSEHGESAATIIRRAPDGRRAGGHTIAVTAILA